MADQDPLAGYTPATSSADSDPLAGWTGTATPPPATPPPPKPLMGTSWKKIGVDAYANPPADENIEPLSGGYLGGRLPPTPRFIGLETPPGWERSSFLPLAGNPTTGERAPALPGFISGLMTEGPQIKDGTLIVPGATWNPATGTYGVTPEAAAAASVFGNPAALRFGPRARPPGGLDLGVPEDAAVHRELTQPPAPFLPDVFKQQRTLIPPDPATQAAIDLLRRSTQSGSSGIPTPPTPFRGAPYQPPPSGGLLDIPAPRIGPTPAAAEAMTEAQMRAVSKSLYSPADQQAAEGVTINPYHSDAIRKPLTDAIPTDPELAGYVGDNDLIRMGKNAQANQGQPMSFDTAMQLDRELTDQRQAAFANKNYTLASRIEDAQDAIRARMQSLPDNATTGDPATLAMLPRARQAYAQSVKQGQLEDIDYRASLRPEDKQDAYKRSQVMAMLGNDRKMLGWSPDERAALEAQLKSGNIGSLQNFGISLLKPLGQATGGFVGSALGPGGTFVGSQVGGELAGNMQGKIRAALHKITLEPVTRQITANMPPQP